MHFLLTDSESFPMVLNTQPLASSSEVKFLGVTLCRSMRWRRHIEDLSGGISGACFVLKMLKPLISLEMLKSIYYSFVVSRIQYGIIFWGYSPHCRRLFILQKRAVRYIAGAASRASCRQYFRRYRLLTLPCMYIYFLCIYVKENYDKCVVNSDVHGYGTRNNGNLHIKKYKFKTLHHSNPNSIGPEIYNRLPHEIKITPKLTAFKSKLKAWLANECFYSIKEFFCKE